MSLLIFIVILIILVMVHELGHFVAAKISKMRVEEFAFGFPPKLFSKKSGSTDYVFNLLPIGGYVKITGESLDEDERIKLVDDKMAFQNRPVYLQLFVLFAGVIMNLLLAVVLFTIVNSGPRLISADDKSYASYVNNPKIYVNYVVPQSPAESSGVKIGDEIIAIRSGNDVADLNSATSVVDIVKRNSDKDIIMVYKRHLGSTSTSTLRAVYGLSDNKKTIGLGVVHGQMVNLNVFDALSRGAKDTYDYTILTIQGLRDILINLIKGEDVMKYLSGPIGIAKIVGSEADKGISNLFLLTAILSINLAVFNILPIPALDGGRILFILIETIFRKKINIKFQYIANTIGFLLLIALMVIVTYFDIKR
jgi:regulator of sigma E protease